MKLITFNDHCRERFGEKLYKLTLDGGFCCPNRKDRSSGGCAFCGGGSGFFTDPGPIEEQLESAKKRVAEKFKGERYMAYFQSYTGTFDRPERLWERYRIPLEREEIAAIAIATRPDCLGPEVLEVLKRCAAQKPLYIELGLQTARDDVAESFGRGYPTARFEEAIAALRSIGEIHVVAHLMIGLPGEKPEDLIRSVEFINRCGVDGVKFHLLYIVENTPYAALYRQGKLSVLSLEEYTQWLAAGLKALKPETVVHRITGDPPKAELIAPLWCGDKKRVLNTLNQMIRNL